MTAIISRVILFLFFRFANCAISTRIVNGTVVNPGDIPYIVSITYIPVGHICGGSIISSKHVITAAHCIRNNGSTYNLKDFIVTNEERLESLLTFWHMYTYKIRKVEKAYFPTTDSLVDNDIAILKLYSPYSFNSTFRTISLQPKKVEEGTSCFVAGWGHNRYNSSQISTHLLYVNVSIIETEFCFKAYENVTFLSNGTICAGNSQGDACQGDSGGPLVCDGKLTGIVSTGVGCALDEYPGLYTNVSHHLNWIFFVINNSSSETLLRKFLLKRIISVVIVQILFIN